MRVRTIAVLAAVALAVASTGAYAIMGSSWTGTATAKVLIKVKGRKPVKAQGTFPSSLYVGSSWIESDVPVFDFNIGRPDAMNVTASAFSFDLQAPAGTYSNRVVRIDRENSSGVSLAHVAVEALVPPIAASAPMSVSATAFAYDFPAPTPPEGFSGLLLDGVGGDTSGSYRAIRNFTEVRGTDTIRFEGLVVGGEDDGRPVKGTIKIVYVGERVL